MDISNISEEVSSQIVKWIMNYELWIMKERFVKVLFCYWSILVNSGFGRIL